MPLLQVRDCPEDIYHKLTAIAHKQHRTIAQQTIEFLEQSLSRDRSNIERRMELIEKIERSDIPGEARLVDDVKWIREDRNR
jgi:predicted nuclease of restriction endonuclease-like RecB superfamily